MKEYLHITDVTEDKNEATYNKGETHSEVSENTTETENNIESSDNKVTMIINLSKRRVVMMKYYRLLKKISAQN